MAIIRIPITTTIGFSVREDWKEEEVAIFVARMLTGEGSISDDDPPWLINGKWRLDTESTWYLRKIGSFENYQIIHKHHKDDFAERALENLSVFLNWQFSRPKEKMKKPIKRFLEKTT